MTHDLETCSSCGAPIPSDQALCPECGTPRGDTPAEESFEAIHLDDAPAAPPRLRVLSPEESRVIDDVTSDYSPLNLEADESVTVVTRRERSSFRVALLLGLVFAAILWAIAEWRIRAVEDWGIWEPIWYVAAVLTIALGIVVVALAWKSARADRNWGAALRSFLP